MARGFVKTLQGDYNNTIHPVTGLTREAADNLIITNWLQRIINSSTYEAYILYNNRITQFINYARVVMQPQVMPHTSTTIMAATPSEHYHN